MSIKSWDRLATKDRISTSPIDRPWNQKYDIPVRVVPWPEGAPDPATVPHANERVTIYPATRATAVYTVVNGIPKKDRPSNLWRLWVRNDRGVSQHPVIDDLRIYVEPPASSKLYSADQIEEAFSATAHSSAVSLIKRMNS